MSNGFQTSRMADTQNSFMKRGAATSSMISARTKDKQERNNRMTGDFAKQRKQVKELGTLDMNRLNNSRGSQKSAERVQLIKKVYQKNGKISSPNGSNPNMQGSPSR